jgi:hypothetical protein
VTQAGGRAAKRLKTGKRAKLPEPTVRDRADFEAVLAAALQRDVIGKVQTHSRSTLTNQPRAAGSLTALHL